MKIEKRHIIILIVAAVAVYLIWKKKKESETPGDGTVGGTNAGGVATGAKDSLDYIYASGLLNTNEKKRCETVRRRAEDSLSYKAQVEAEAARKGYSYDQMIVMKAIWELYNPTGNGWEAGPDGSTSYGYILMDKVLRLNRQSLW